MKPLPASSTAAKSSSQLTGGASSSKAGEDRLEDLNSLAAINNLIEQFLSTRPGNIEILRQIGSIAQQIKFKDSDPTCVRNKYGLVDRSRGAARREGGLELNHLEALAKIFGDESHAASSSSSVSSSAASLATGIEAWQGDLFVIRQKISLILEAEKELTAKNYDQVLARFSTLPKTINFQREVGQRYVAKIRAKILEIAHDSILPSLNFASREDRYYFGNVLLKVGELSKELIDFSDVKQDGNLLSFFKQIRNLMLHLPQAMIDGFDATSQNYLQLAKDELLPKLVEKIGTLNLETGAELVPQIIPEAEKELQKAIKSIFKKTKSGAKKDEAVEEGEREDVSVKNKEEINAGLLIALSELEYLRLVQNSASINPEKKSYILQFCAAKIALCLNDVGKFADTPLQTHTQNAPIFRDSMARTVAARNHGIAHDIFGFDENNFLKNIESNALTIRQDLESLLEISYFDRSGLDGANAKNIFDLKSRSLARDIAHQHLRLGNYAEAKSILEQTFASLANEEAAQTVAAGVLGGKRFSSSHEAFSFYEKYLQLKHDTLRSLGHTNLVMEKNAEALDAYNKAGEIERTTNGEVSNQTLLSQGLLLGKLKRAAESRQKFNEVIARPNGGRDVIQALLHQAGTLQEGGFVAEARANFQKLELNLGSNLIGPAEKITILTDIAVFEIQNGGSKQKALSLLKSAQELFEKNQGHLKDHYGNDFVEVEKKILGAEMIILMQPYKVTNPAQMYAVANAVTAEDVGSLNRLCDKVEKFRRAYNIIQAEIPKSLVEGLAMTFFNIASNAEGGTSPLRDPELVLKFNQNALSLLQAYDIPEHKSMVLMGVGASYLRVAQSGKNPQENFGRAEEYLRAAVEDKNLNVQSQTVAHRSLGIICYKKQDFRSAINHFKFCCDQLPDRTSVERQMVDDDMVACFNGLRIKTAKFKAAEELLVKAYGKVKNDPSKTDLILSSAAIVKDDLQQYLREELKHEAPVQNSASGLRIILTTELRAGLEEKLTKASQSAQKR